MTYNEFIQNIIDTRGQWSDEVRYSDRGCERHHIIPKCMGGMPLNSHTWDFHENIIWLYPAEHYTAHKLLALENQNNMKLVFAWNAMHRLSINNSNIEKIITAEEYEILRKSFSNFMKSIERNDHWKSAIGEANRVRILPEDFGTKISETKKNNNKIREEARLIELVNSINKEQFIEVYYHNTDKNIINWGKSIFNKFYCRDIAYLLSYWGLRKKNTKEINDIKIATMYKNYGVVNNFQRQEIKETCKQVKLEKYGNEYYSNHNQAQETILKKYGTKNMFNYHKNDNTSEVIM